MERKDWLFGGNLAKNAKNCVQNLNDHENVFALYINRYLVDNVVQNLEIFTMSLIIVL